MGGCRCSYKDCKNTTKITDNIHFFHYPVKQNQRCRVWILRANKPQFFDLDEFQLRNKVICEVHFEDKCFLNSQKKRLLPNAIPTLDGYSIIEPQSSIITGVVRTERKPKQIPTRLEDVQILPASEDGTLFVLDTYPTFKVSKDVESFIINNDDSILPIKDPDQIKRERNDEDNFDTNEYILSDDGNFNVFQQNTTKEQQILNNHENIGNHTEIQQKSPKKLSDEALESMICKTVESKYLPKLEQHTKDLNQIKKALRLSKTTNKVNKTSVLRYLKLRLPPSLFTLVNLSIEDDYNFTEDDKNFFRNLHDSSAKAYQFLMEDCNWNMPIIQVQDGNVSPMEDD